MLNLMNKLTLSRLAVSKLQAIILLTVVVFGALVAVNYFYQSQLMPAQPTPSPSPSPSPSPMPSTAPAALKYSNLNVEPTEAWPGQLVNASLDVSNTGNESISYLLPFSVNGVVNQTVEVQLAGRGFRNRNGDI